MAQFLYKTVKPSGGDYTSLEACMNANEQDLTGDGWFDVEIDGTWSSADTTAVTIHNYTITSADYINIYTKAGTARHDGTPDNTTAYSLTALLFIGQMGSAADVLKIDGIYFGQGGYIGCGNYANFYFTVKNCLFIGTNNGKIWCWAPPDRGKCLIYNCIFIYTGTDQYGAGIFGLIPVAEGDIQLYNCTFNCGEYTNGATITGILVKNCISFDVFQGGGRGCFIGTAASGSDYNVSDDTTAPDGGNSQINVTPTFVDEPGNDLHLAVTDTIAIDLGTDLSATFTIDIDGDTRVTWDIGADEYVAAGGEVYYTTINNAVICNAIIG